MQVLHLTAHLGGGVGKALSGLVAQANRAGNSSNVNHCIVCLEMPVKDQFIENVRAHGGRVIVCPDPPILEKLLVEADIVQLEWWNHPATIKTLCSLSDTIMRLITWSHISGLYNPIIPRRLIQASQVFLFTSECSYENPFVQEILHECGERVGVISSSGGFSELPQIYRQPTEKLSVGYIGSLNFAKLHPKYIDYLVAVELSDFRVRLIGDITNEEILKGQAERLGKRDLLEFRGYTAQVATELAGINVLAYLLNPEHYGTAENALLEAMAMEIVPVVLDNPAERQIVSDHQTGLIVGSPHEFAEAILWLFSHPDERQRLGKQAAQSVRERFCVEKMETAFNARYKSMLSHEKKRVNFNNIFGENPAEWFLSCQGNKSIFSASGKISPISGISGHYGLFEKNKGTVFQFSEYFPDSKELRLWAENLKSLQ